jgi:hypothetical protein
MGGIVRIQITPRRERKERKKSAADFNSFETEKRVLVQGQETQ